MYLVNIDFIDIEQITDELTEQHRAYLAKEYEKGTLAFGGRKVPRTGGILISNHSSLRALESLIKQDPFVTSGVVDYTITEFEPVMASQDFHHVLAD